MTKTRNALDVPRSVAVVTGAASRAPEGLREDVREEAAERLEDHG